MMSRMPSPVGPAPRDPNDPDFWDWGDDEDDAPSPPRRSPAFSIVAALVVIGLVVLLLTTRP
jgi:hypothetical protein